MYITTNNVRFEAWIRVNFRSYVRQTNLNVCRKILILLSGSSYDTDVFFFIRKLVYNTVNKISAMMIKKKDFRLGGQ